MSPFARGPNRGGGGTCVRADSTKGAPPFRCASTRASQRCARGAGGNDDQPSSGRAAVMACDPWLYDHGESSVVRSRQLASRGSPSTGGVAAYCLWGFCGGECARSGHRHRTYVRIAACLCCGTLRGCIGFLGAFLNSIQMGDPTKPLWRVRPPVWFSRGRDQCRPSPSGLSQPASRSRPLRSLTDHGVGEGLLLLRSGQSGDWKESLQLPARDTRYRTEVCAMPAATALSTLSTLAPVTATT